MKFKISSALKDHIGKELITDNNVAIFELVKNSYDAEAKNVKIIFKDMRSPQRKIYIIDDGKGMSEQDLEEKWFFLGYSEKRDLEELNKKNKSKRFLAGEEDQKKEFISIDVNTSKQKVLRFDFGEFDNPGTIIEISNLRDEWSWKDLQKTKRYMQRLINPLQIPNEDSFVIELVAATYI